MLGDTIINTVSKLDEISSAELILIILVVMKRNFEDKGVYTDALFAILRSIETTWFTLYLFQEVQN